MSRPTSRKPKGQPRSIGFQIANDFTALTVALTTLLSDARLRETMGRAARARAEAQFDWHMIAGQWLQVLECAMGALTAPAQEATIAVTHSRKNER